MHEFLVVGVAETHRHTGIPYGGCSKDTQNMQEFVVVGVAETYKYTGMRLG